MVPVGQQAIHLIASMIVSTLMVVIIVVVGILITAVIWGESTDRDIGWIIGGVISFFFNWWVLYSVMNKKYEKRTQGASI